MRFLPNKTRIERFEEEYPAGWTLVVSFEPPLELDTDDPTSPQAASPVYDRSERTNDPSNGYSIVNGRRLKRAGVTYMDADGKVVEAFGRISWKPTES